MDAPEGNAAASRPGMRRLFPPPWEYGHLRAWAGARMAAGTVLAGLGAVTLVRGGFNRKACGWAGFFLAMAGLATAGGIWEMNIARSERLPERQPAPGPQLSPEGEQEPQ
jgi:hypothetical protein